MRIRSDRWQKIAVRGRFTFDAKARINGKDYTAISAPRIERSLMSTPFSVGNCISATLNLSILTTDTITSDMPVKILGRVFNENTSSEWLEFGTFFINQRSTSFESIVTIDCFDAMLKANAPYLGDNDNSQNDWPKSMTAVVSEIADKLGVGIDERTLIQSGTDYVVPYPSDKTIMQVLGAIGACHGGNWIITEDNLLRLIPLITAPDETFHVIDADFQGITVPMPNQGAANLIYRQQEQVSRVLPAFGGSTPASVIKQTYHVIDENDQTVTTPEGHSLAWDDGHTAYPECVINIPVVCGQITTGTKSVITRVTVSDESGNVYTEGDDDGVTLDIGSNPYATSGICLSLYNAYHGLVYLPFTASKALYDPATELGDQVIIGDKVFSVILNSRLTLDHNFRADIEAPNSEELSTEYPYIS